MDKLFDNLGLICLFVFGIGGWVIVDVVKSIASNWRKKHESEHMAALKQSMVERGMAAEEIERVVDAGRPREAPSDENANLLAKLINRMMKQGKSTEEIERIVNAWHGQAKLGNVNKPVEDDFKPAPV